MRGCKREPSVDELLSDPMMSLVFDRYRTTADDVRALMQEIAARLATERARDSEETVGG